MVTSNKSSASNTCTSAAAYTLVNSNQDCQPSTDWKGKIGPSACSKACQDSGYTFFLNAPDNNCKCCSNSYRLNSAQNFNVYQIAPKQSCDWRVVGTGYCFQGAKDEELPKRLTDWIVDSVENAKAACCSCSECKGIHYDWSAKDYVLLTSTGIANGGASRTCYSLAARNTVSNLTTAMTNATTTLTTTNTTWTSTTWTDTATAPVLLHPGAIVILGIIAGIFFIVLSLWIFYCVYSYEKAQKVYSIQQHPKLKREDSGTVIGASLIPSTWSSCFRAGGSDIAFDQMFLVPSASLSVFDDLLSATYRAACSQDRRCPKNTCPKTKGGCPCVQIGGDPGLPVGYRALQVIRTEDSHILKRYLAMRDHIKTLRSEASVTRPDPSVVTDSFVSSHPESFDQLDGTINEVYLWHGTKVRSALSIAQCDFDLSFAGSHAGTMYGRGVYLSESCTKADEYAEDEPDGYYQGIYALVLCRVVLGEYFYTQDRNPNAHVEVQSGRYDSTLGDRLKKVDTFREFVVYNADQIYPEFVVVYQRNYSSDDADAIKRVGSCNFSMQLPVYWRNCHVDPSTTIFNEHFQVSSFTKKQLTSLVQSCTPDLDIAIIDARRIENSKIWNTYIDFKLKLRKELKLRSGDDSVTSLLDLQEDADDRWEVLTYNHVKHENANEIVHVEYFEENLGEHLLWHGTSKTAAETIVEEDFSLQNTGRHGKRFGEGIYLADLVNKSLDYAESTAAGTKFLLLCRVCLGEVHYTEDNDLTDAHSVAKSNGKHSVVANPNKKGPREFIVLQPEQLYPEYMLEVKIVAPGS